MTSNTHFGSVFRRTALAIGLAAAMATPGAAVEFSFADVSSLADMQALLQQNFPLGSSQAELRALFEAGGAAHYAHPEQDGVEKYVYDIDLCQVYVWRWNVSSNADAGGALTQIFVNGDPVHAGGDAPVTPESRAQPGTEQAILQGARPRPEASKGESQLAFIMFDLDTATDRASDEFAVGAGPSNADPADLGQMHAYQTERWRSIFDDEPARSVVPFSGACE